MNGWDGRRIRTLIAVAALVVVAGVAVFRVPLQSFFVLGVALVCPLLMIGMHAGGHGHGTPRGASNSNRSARLPEADSDPATEAER